MKFKLMIFLVTSSIATCMLAQTSLVTNTDAGSVQKLQQEFNRRSAEINPQLKEAPRQTLDLVQQILGEADGSIREHELDRLCKEPSNTRFDNLLSQAFVERLLGSSDTNRLVALLKMNCPEYVAAVPLELVLATSNQPDAILMLTSTYSRGGTNNANKAVVKCLSRAFPRLRAASQSDISFVESCENWWSAYGLRCTLNHHYAWRPNAKLQDFERRQYVGLFIAWSK